MTAKLKSRTEALAKGLKTYVGSVPCKHCGSFIKHTSSYSCSDCNIKRSKHKLYNKDLMNPYRTKAKQNAKTYRYRARKQNATTPDADHNKILKIYKECEMKTKKTGVVHHVDHIIPLSKGGLHHHKNLQVITAKENWTKGDRLC